MRSMQDIFVEVTQRLAAQGCHSADEIGVHCLLRASETVRDPVGWLIPDRLWSPDLEGLSVGNRGILRVLQRAGIPIMSPGYISLISDLQRMHDDAMPYEWPRELAVIAAGHSLDGAVIVRAFRNG